MKLKLDDFNAFSNVKKQEFARKKKAETALVLIGLGTCGIAAGGARTRDAMLDELEKCGLSDVIVQQTGCMGLCYSEPTVEVRYPGMPDIVYGKVDEETGRKIVRRHLLQQQLVNDHIYDKPAVDVAVT